MIFNFFKNQVNNYKYKEYYFELIIYFNFFILHTIIFFFKCGSLDLIVKLT